jgi:glycyl-tRNA synthetase
MNPKVWEASGHVAGFSDPLIDCKKCKSRERADKLIEDMLFAFSQKTPEKSKEVEKKYGNLIPGSWTFEQQKEFIDTYKVKCPKC